MSIGICMFSLDVDECAKGLHNCSDNATCTNTPGSYDCTCLIGYSGNGFQCEGEIGMLWVFMNPSVIMYVYTVDIDECEDGNMGGCTQFCTNTDGSFICGCETGYNLGGDGLNCLGERIKLVVVMCVCVCVCVDVSYSAVFSL